MKKSNDIKLQVVKLKSNIDNVENENIIDYRYDDDSNSIDGDNINDPDYCAYSAYFDDLDEMVEFDVEICKDLWNTIVQPSIDKNDRQILKLKNSVIQSDKLRKIPNDSGVPEGCNKKIILDVKMRWNSLYYMIDRYVDMSKIATQLLLDATDSPALVTGQEIEILKQLIPLLQPFEFVTRESSGQNYVTISKIIPMINCLISQLTKFSSSIECVTQLQTKLLAECKKRFGLIEFNTLAALATISDPRF